MHKTYIKSLTNVLWISILILCLLAHVTDEDTQRNTFLPGIPKLYRVIYFFSFCKNIFLLRTLEIEAQGNALVDRHSLTKVSRETNRMFTHENNCTKNNLYLALTNTFS